jgi:hypothetical protein
MAAKARRPGHANAIERSFLRRRIDPLYRVHEMIGRTAVLVVLAMLVLTGTAAADGDPASDVLYLKNVFLPFPAPPRDAANALQGAVDRAYARRFRVKVAVVASAPDLGSVPELFNKPTQYGKFLGTELRSFYVGPLLVAMPAGFGVYDGGRSTAAEERVLAQLTTRATTGEQLTRLSTAAVERLTAAGALRSKDITKPFALALPSTGTRGGTAKLRYAASDDSMRARLAIRITTGAGAAASHVTAPLRELRPQRITTVTWHVPRKASSRLRFCLVAIDAAGNRSTQACAPLRVR